LSTPPAFVLSQDQTLHQNSKNLNATVQFSKTKLLLPPAGHPASACRPKGATFVIVSFLRRLCQFVLFG
ncbi:MAG: hypothetical protein KMY50_02835, partial [Candidatus Desulforudis sp.]|nr:hypothetical protein [Desulforudis sp.]